jgi:hypothetical protein
LVDYRDEPDGLHVVVTTQRGVRVKTAVERFETVLAAGQSAGFSIPRAAGEAPERVVLTNAGGHLQIAEPPAAVSAPVTPHDEKEKQLWPPAVALMRVPAHDSAQAFPSRLTAA